MDSYKNILIASDLGMNTVALIDRAMSMMDDDSQLTLLHVVRPIETTFFGTMPYIPIMPLGDKDKFEQNLFDEKNRLIQAIAKRYDLADNQCLIVRGDPKERIVNFAQSNKCDLIITASTHVKKIRPYIGSTTKAILQKADCDVLVVQINH